VKKLLLVLAILLTLSAAGAQQPKGSVLVVDGLGKGTVALDGPWQFHLGDDMAWANPAFDDSTGHDGWEQLTADRPWGAQGHPAYTGIAWYRRRIQIKSAPGDAREIALLIPGIENCYEIYWNGQKIAQFGKLPPDPVWYIPETVPAQSYGVGEAKDGVMALRIWRAPLISDESEKSGGPQSVPFLGTSAGISSLKDRLDYEWLRQRQYSFAQSAVYALVMLLSLIAWLRNRKDSLLLWMSLFCVAPLILLVDGGLHLRITYGARILWLDQAWCVLNVSLWFLLLGLLELREDPHWARFTRIVAWIYALSMGLDTATVGGSWWANSKGSDFFSTADWILTAIYTLLSSYPLVLVAVAIRKRHGHRLDLPRWLVAIFACFSGLVGAMINDLRQGQRFTHWTLGDRLGAPMFSVNGNDFTLQTVSDALLLLAILYAVYAYTREAARRQNALQQEYRNARAVQQVLLPEAIPQVQGFAIGSCYKPAGEVGGDFFQILATRDGGVLAVIGDVSGKGMPAAMTVSLLVGTVRTLVHYTQSPGEILTAMNVRMLGRSQGGFTTCLVLRADADGGLTVANAGHIAPYLAGKELPLENGLPLGLAAEATYPESVFQMKPEEQLTLLTDGVVEAREKSGALFGFERTAAIVKSSDAEAIARAAQDFGQDDDITVLTVARTPQENGAAA